MTDYEYKAKNYEYKAKKYKSKYLNLQLGQGIKRCLVEDVDKARKLSIDYIIRNYRQINKDLNSDNRNVKDIIWQYTKY